MINEVSMTFSTKNNYFTNVILISGKPVVSKHCHSEDKAVMYISRVFINSATFIVPIIMVPTIDELSFQNSFTGMHTGTVFRTHSNKVPSPFVTRYTTPNFLPFMPNYLRLPELERGKRQSSQVTTFWSFKKLKGESIDMKSRRRRRNE